MKELKKAQMGMIAILTVMLVSITRRLPTRKFSSGITTLALAGIVLLVAAGTVSANCACDDGWCESAAGGAGAAAFTCGETVDESCTFDANMVCPNNAPGLYVGAAGITINGAGYKMTGARDTAACSVAILGGPPTDSNPAMHSGIANSGFATNGNWNNVEITDLEIEEFCTGIAFGDMAHTNVDFNKVTNCSIHDCGDPGYSTHGIHMVQTNYSSVKCNSIHNIDGSHLMGCSGGGNGIFMYGDITLEDGWHNSFTCNNLSDNAKSGFFMKHQCMYNYLGNNYAVRNGEGGIVPMCMRSHYNTYDRNNMSYNGKWGFMTRGTGNNIINNTIIGNGAGSMGPGAGISIGASANPAGNVVDDNCVCGNLGTDINIDAACICNDNTCDVIIGGTGSLCPWNCNDPTSVYYNFDEDASYSGLFGTCSNLLQVGAGNNPGLFDTAGASTHCDGSFCTYPDPGDDLNDCGPSAPAAQPYYCDFDGDGYFNADSSGSAEELPSGCQWAQGDDCDDTNAAINPGAAENCTDNIDNDCDELVDGDDPDCFPNKVYFMPEDIRIPKYCDTTNVSVWIDTEDVIGSGIMELYYADCCMNVTGYTMNDTHWTSDSKMNIETPGFVRIFITAKGDGVGPGLLHIGNITVHCCNETSYCFTGLDWDKDPDTSYLFNDVPAKIDVNWMDGTFRCNIPDLEITMVKGNEINETYYNVSYTIENTGDVPASESYTSLKVDGDPNPIETMHVLGFEPHENRTYNFTSKINQTGTVDTLMVCADWNDTVVELDEDNNCMKGRYPGEVVIRVMPADTFVQPQDQFDVKIYVDTKGMEVYAVQYCLTYDTSVVRAETQNKDSFLGPISETMVVVNYIDQPHGEVSYAESRKVPGAVTESDNVTNIHFIAIGPRSATTNLTLDDIIISDEDGIRIDCRIEDGTVEITENTPPVPIGVTKHRVNNVAQKYQSTTILCSCSYDPDYPDKGGNITYIRWAFGDGQYGTSEGLPDENNCTCKEHRYESWQWDPLGMPYNPEHPELGGNYVPFDVQLDVMDDGCPELTNNTNITIDVFIAGDANGDGEVNILDAVWVGKNWRAECACNPYPENYPETLPDYCGCDCEGNYWNDVQADNGADGADLNNDCEINILDAVIIGANWRHTAW